MKVKIIGSTVAMMMAFSFTSCDGTTPAKPEYDMESVDKTVGISSDANLIQLTKSQQRVIASNKEFSLNVFNRLYKSNENTLLSPLSLTMAVSMLANGAEGETLEEILNTLGGSSNNLDIEKLNENCKILSSRLSKVDTKVKLSLANSLWTDVSFPVLESYKASLSSTFAADAYTAKLNTEETRKAINEWCSSKTDGKIPEFLKDPYRGSMILINALNFDASWSHCFTGYDEVDFTNYDGTVSKVGMMYRRENFRYAEINGVKAIELPYTSGAFAMKVIMPESEGFLLDTGRLFTIDKALYEEEKTFVEIGIPSIELNSEMRLEDILQILGIRRIFNREKAELGKITKSDGLFIEMVKQQVVLATDMLGTSAAAVTLEGMSGSSGIEPVVPPVIVTIDRPFYFVIEEKSSGQILFMGHISKL